MIANIVANYLVNKGRISMEQYAALFAELSKVRARVGLIAVHEGLMTEYQADFVNLLQSTMDMKFGDLAVEKGLLTNAQVGELLKKQGDPYLSLAQALENLGIMRLTDLDLIMKKFQAENELSASSIEALKSDDVDRIVPLFLPIDADDYLDMALLSTRTIMRCVDTNIIPLHGYYTDNLEVQKGAIQFVDGDPCLTFGMCGDGRSLIGVASTFGQEDFEEVDMDALDAVAELVNCINGMYASEKSRQRIRMELYPPQFDDSIEGVCGAKMLVLPMIIGDKSVYLVFCNGERLSFR